MSRFLLILVVTAMTVAQAATGCAQSVTVAEQYLLSAINQERIGRNLAPVRIDAALTQAAAEHARQMAAHRGISHRFPDEPELSTRGSAAGARFDRITENVAEGPTVLVLHDAWMHSPGHRANILDPAVDAVGIAVVARNGQLYAVQDFEHSVQRLSFEQQEAAVAVLLDQAGLDLLPDTNARRTCAQASGYAGEEQPAFIVRYTTADLATLPSRLRARLASGQDHRASVGACAASARSAFSNYSIAVVLYP